MTGTQTIWISREPVLAPASARILHMQDAALVATPEWTVRVLTASGSLEPFSAEVNQKLLAQYFPDLLEEDF